MSDLICNDCGASQEVLSESLDTILGLCLDCEEALELDKETP